MTARKRVAWWEILIVIAITALAAALRFMQIGDEGLWLDEAFSVWMARLSLGELFSWIVRIDQHPPLYYLMLHGWLSLGDGEASIRSLSALLGTATVPVLYFVARRLLGAGAATAAALLLAVSPFNIRFAQEARMYTLMTFNISVALLGLAYLITGDQRRRWWVMYVVFTWLVLLSHNTALIFPLAVNAGMGVAAWIAHRRPDSGLPLPPLGRWLWAQAAVFLLWLPWGPSFVLQARAVDREFWIPPPTATTVTDTVKTLVSAFLPPERWWAMVAGGVALVLGIVALGRKPALRALLLVLTLAPFVIELLVSLRRPIFYDRTLIWVTLPLSLLLAASVTQTDWHGMGKALAAGAIGLLLVGNIYSLRWYYESFHKEQWREAAAWVAQRSQPDDLLLFNATWVQIPFDYYFDRFGRPNPEHGAPVDMFDAGVLEPKMGENDVARLEQLAAGANCLYLVYSHDWYTDPQGLVPRTLRTVMRMVRQQRFLGLDVQQYERPGTEGCRAAP